MRKRYLLAAPLALIGAAWFYWVTLPWPVLLRWRDPGPTAFMNLRMEQARRSGDDLELRQTWAPLENISRNLRRAVLVAEDGNFRKHSGIDWAALRDELHYRGDAEFSWRDPDDLRAAAAAMRYYLENREKIRGRSTITQQLAKNLYFDESRSLLRKMDEFVVARRLERFLSKDRILELYLNLAEWGPGVFGAEAAAQHYFNRSAESLTREQAAALAATLPHPLTSNPKTRPGRMAWRKQLILTRMTGEGPTRTVPLEPLRIEEPELPEVPELEIRDSVIPLPADTIRLDTLPRPDTAVVDTMRRDTTS